MHAPEAIHKANIRDQARLDRAGDLSRRPRPIGQRSYPPRDGFRRDWQIGRWLPVLVLSAGNSKQSVGADHLTDATDLTALPFDQLPTTTFSIALPFLHRPLIVGGDVATSVYTWARQRERVRDRERMRAAKETAGPRWEDVYTARYGKRRGAFVRRIAAARPVASRRIGPNYSAMRALYLSSARLHAGSARTEMVVCDLPAQVPTATVREIDG